MSSFYELKKGILSRVLGVEGIVIKKVSPYYVMLYIQPKANFDYKDVLDGVNRALRYLGTEGIQYDVTFSKQLPQITQAPLRGKYKLATASTLTDEINFKHCLAKLVPDLSRLTLDYEVVGAEKDKKIRVVRVEGIGGDISKPFLREVGIAVGAISIAGEEYRVEALKGAGIRNDLVNAGFFYFDNTHTKLVRDFQIKEEERFSARMAKLLTGSYENVVGVDDYSGSKIVCTPNSFDSSPIQCFLPLYDKIFVQVTPGVKKGGKDIIFDHTGIYFSDFMELCKLGKIVPVFNFDLRAYDKKLIDIFFNDPALHFLSSRELDYLSAKHIWRSNPYIKDLRSNRPLSTKFFEIQEKIFDGIRSDGDSKLAFEERSFVPIMMSKMQVLADKFEGYLWESGHIALGNSGNSLGVTTALSQVISGLKYSDAIKQTLEIESHISCSSLSMANAFDSSLYYGVGVNEFVIEIISRLWANSIDLYEKRDISLLQNIISSCELNYNEGIPANEYIDIFDDAETRRMRKIFGEILKVNSESGFEEMRSLLQSYNRGISKIRKKGLLKTNVDVIGTVSDAMSSGGKVLESKQLEAIGEALRLAKKPIDMAIDSLVEDTYFGDVADKFRGWINRVPSQSVRIYRLQNKLRRFR